MTDYDKGLVFAGLIFGIMLFSAGVIIGSDGKHGVGLFTTTVATLLGWCVGHVSGNGYDRRGEK